MLNSVILMGRLTRNPEAKVVKAKNNDEVKSTKFTLAVSRTYNSKEVDFIDIVAWRSTAEFVKKYFNKGQLVAVKGAIQTNKYEDKNGNKKTAVYVLADNVYFAERKQDNENKKQDNTEQTGFTEITPDEDLPF